MLGLELDLASSDLKLTPSGLLQIKLVSFDLWLVPLGLQLALSDLELAPLDLGQLAKINRPRAGSVT